jgi:EH_Signature domain
MNSNFSEIILPNFSAPKPLELSKRLEQYQNISSNSQFLLLQNLLNLDLPHLRTLDEIIDAIEKDQFNSIQLLEWLYCISYKKKWDDLHPDRSLATSRKIWAITKQVKHLKQFLFWELVLKYGDRNNNLADSLVDGFGYFISESIEDKKIINIIKILAGDLADERIAKICEQYLLTPHALFNYYKLPTNRIEPVTSAYDYIADLFVIIRKPNDNQVKWLLDCLDLMAVEQEIKAVDKLLTKVGAEIGIDRPDLVNWISARYRQGGNIYRRNQLSSKAREALRKWQGAVNYGDFQKLVDIILYRSQIYLEDYEQRRLENRQIFWSNYTDRFEQIRILLPQSSRGCVKDSLSTKDICVLEDDGNETEVCIFDFKELLVVEFFRGEGSETRIFLKTTELEQILFHSDNLSSSKIKCLGGDIHDHLKYWQHDRERWLRENGISPNEGNKFFRITSDLTIEYNSNHGIPLSRDKARKREDALRRRR